MFLTDRMMISIPTRMMMNAMIIVVMRSIVALYLENL